MSSPAIYETPGEAPGLLDAGRQHPNYSSSQRDQHDPASAAEYAEKAPNNIRLLSYGAAIDSTRSGEFQSAETHPTHIAFDPDRVCGAVANGDPFASSAVAETFVHIAGSEKLHKTEGDTESTLNRIALATDAVLMRRKQDEAAQGNNEHKNDRADLAGFQVRPGGELDILNGGQVNVYTYRSGELGQPGTCEQHTTPQAWEQNPEKSTNYFDGRSANWAADDRAQDELRTTQLPTGKTLILALPVGARRNTDGNEITPDDLREFIDELNVDLADPNTATYVASSALQKRPDRNRPAGALAVVVDVEQNTNDDEPQARGHVDTGFTGEERPIHHISRLSDDGTKAENVRVPGEPEPWVDRRSRVRRVASCLRISNWVYKGMAIRDSGGMGSLTRIKGRQLYEDSVEGRPGKRAGIWGVDLATATAVGGLAWTLGRQVAVVKGWAAPSASSGHVHIPTPDILPSFDVDAPPITETNNLGPDVPDVPTEPKKGPASLVDETVGKRTAMRHDTSTGLKDPHESRGYDWARQYIHDEMIEAGASEKQAKAAASNEKLVNRAVGEFYEDNKLRGDGELKAGEKYKVNNMLQVAEDNAEQWQAQHNPAPKEVLIPPVTESSNVDTPPPAAQALPSWHHEPSAEEIWARKQNAVLVGLGIAGLTYTVPAAIKGLNAARKKSKENKKNNKDIYNRELKKGTTARHAAA